MAKRARQLEPPPNYLRQREQWRILALVVMLGLVILLMNEARKPKNWAWMWVGQQVVDGDAKRTDAQQTTERVDTRLRPGAGAADQNRLDGLTPLVSRARQPRPTGDLSRREAISGLSAEQLASVKDDTVLGAAERDAWFDLLAMLDEADEQQLREASTGGVGFVQLYKQPKQYRGKLVTIRGTVRRAHWVNASENDRGIERYCLCWLRVAGGPNSPAVIYSLNMPEGFPTGMQLNEEVEFTGFFFKRLAYLAKDTIRTAPLILTKAPVWQPPQQVEQAAGLDPVLLSSAVLGAALLGIVIAWLVYRSGHRPSVGFSRRLSLLGFQRDWFSSRKFADRENEIAQSLRRLAQQGPASEASPDEKTQANSVRPFDTSGGGNPPG